MRLGGTAGRRPACLDCLASFLRLVLVLFPCGIAVLIVGEGCRERRCGGCRQKLREFGSDDTPVHLCGPEGHKRTVTLGSLLPLSFGPHNLGPAQRHKP